MSQSSAALVEEVLVGRRASPRHRLDISARMITPAVNVRVQLEDISASGACLRLMHPQRIEDGRLCWLNFDVYARSVWNDGIRCGLVFDELLADECLKQTLDFARSSTRSPDDKFLRLASAWVHGPGDW
jgi:hypothetical protein